MQLNINTDELVKLTNKLERLHRSALPVAVRGALNNAAFDVKKNTMLKTSEDAFINRQKNFFKANSSVKMASGFDIESMEAVIGFESSKLKGSSNYSVKDLEQQENGGTIKGRTFIAMKQARASNSNVKNVRPNNRISGIKNIKKVSQNKNNFARTVHSAGIGGHVLNSKALFRVDKIAGRTFKVTPLYSFKKSRSVQVKKTGFMQKASLMSAKKLEGYFTTQARKQFVKL